MPVPCGFKLVVCNDVIKWRYRVVALVAPTATIFTPHPPRYYCLVTLYTKIQLHIISQNENMDQGQIDPSQSWDALKGQSW